MISRILRRAAGRICRLATETPRKAFVHCGQNVVIGDFVKATFPDRVWIGSDVYIGPYAFLSSQGGLTIEDGAVIGPYAAVYTADHNYESGEAIPYDGKVLLKPVRIRCNVWVGGHVTIVPGVTIGEGAVIGAGAVVCKDLPDLAVAVGNPARVVKSRDRKRYEELKQAGAITMRLLSRGQLNRTEVTYAAPQGDIVQDRPRPEAETGPCCRED